MDDMKWERWGLLGGLAGVVLLLVTFLASGPPPDSDAGGVEVADYYSDKNTGIQIGTIALALAVIVLAWWFGSLWRRMRRSEGGEPRLAVVAALGFVLSGGMAMIAFAVNGALAMRIDDVGTDAGIFFAIANGMLGMSTVGSAIAVAAVTGVAARTGFLPSWLVYGGAGLVVVQLIGSASIATQSAVIAVFALLAFLLWLVWIAAVSTVLYRETPTPAVSA